MGCKNKTKIVNVRVRWEKTCSEECDKRTWQWNLNRNEHLISLGKEPMYDIGTVFELILKKPASDRLRKLWCFRNDQKKFNFGFYSQMYSYKGILTQEEENRVSYVNALRAMARDGKILLPEYYKIIKEDNKIKEEK